MFIQHSSQVLLRVPEDFSRVCFSIQLNPVKIVINSVNELSHVDCCYYYIIYIPHGEVPILLRYASQGLSHGQLKGRCSIMQAKWQILPLVQTQLAQKTSLPYVLFSQENLPKSRNKIHCSEKTVATSFEGYQLCVYGISILYGHRVFFSENCNCPPFFLAMNQLAHGEFEGFVMSYSSGVSISAQREPD